MYTPGWDDILEALSEAVDMHERHVETVGRWRATDVKEKFGILRITAAAAQFVNRPI